MSGSNEPRFAMLLRAFQIIISPRNLTLAHVTSLLVGHQMMMQSNVSSLLPMPLRAGFADVSSGPTQSLFLAFVSGKKARQAMVKEIETALTDILYLFRDPQI